MRTAVAAALADTTGVGSERIELLVTVKAYPSLSQKYGEVVCVAGVRTDIDQPEWVRLFPVGFRDLPFSDQFKKYQRISLEAHRHDGDKRPETYRPNVQSIRKIGEPISSRRAWAARRPFVDPLIIDSMCELQRRQERDGTSLGAFRPAEVSELTIDTDVGEWSEAKAAVAAQPSLFNPQRHGLEQIPYRFRYRYRCSDLHCRGHHQMMIDWEIGESFRSWRQRYEHTELLGKLPTRCVNRHETARRTPDLNPC